MKKKRFNDDRKQRMCDPGMCDNCVYLGEGDFGCDNPRVSKGGEMVIVVSDWESTKDYMACKKANIRSKSEYSANKTEGKNRGR